MKSKKQDVKKAIPRKSAPKKPKAWQNCCTGMRNEKKPLIAIRLKDLRCLDTQGIFSDVGRSEYLGLRWQEYVDPFRLPDLIDWLRDETKNQDHPKAGDDPDFPFYGAIMRAGEQRMASIWLGKLTFDGVAVCIGDVDRILEKPNS